jgi:Fe2+ transport system protein FeoA
MNEHTIISLCDLEKNQEATIVIINTNDKEAKRLADLGLTPNTPIKIIRKTMFCGPMEVHVRGANIALGKGLAAKILVKIS